MSGWNTIFTLMFCLLELVFAFSEAHSYAFEPNFSDNFSFEISLPENYAEVNKPLEKKIKEAEEITQVFKPGNFLNTFSFWSEWKPILLILIWIIVVIYIVYRIRILHLMAIEKLKNSISADLHDEIGASLTNINFLSAIIKKKVKDGEIKAYLDNLNQEVQASCEALDEIVWNLKIPDESLEELVINMRRYSSRIFEQENIGYKVKIQEKFKERMMSLQQRRALFLIFKELINNLRKHSKATFSEIEINESDKMFHLTLRDNGVGFDPEESTERNGLKNIKQRLAKWRGKIKIYSSPRTGSLIEIWLPYESRRFYELF